MWTFSSCLGAITIRHVHKGYNHKGQWATTYSIQTTWATTQGSLGTNLVQYPNLLGYNPRVVGHQPNTMSQPLGIQPKGYWALTQYNIPTSWDTTQGSLGTNPIQLISPSISVILNSVHRGVSSQVNPSHSIEEYDLENVS
jgi:hypothetical protein